MSRIQLYKHRKQFGVMVKVPDDLSSIPGHVSEYFCKFYFVEFV